MGLFKPIWMTDKSEKKQKALQAVYQVNDQAVLKDIAINAPLKDVAMAACQRVTSERDLADIALADDIYKADMRVAAAKRITDQDLLYKIAKECPLKEAWGYAISKLGNPEKICQLWQFHAGKEDIDYYVGRAVENNVDRKALYSFLKSGKYLPHSEKILRQMEKADLLSLASDPVVDRRVREAGCESIGHVREIGCYRCVCDRCGKKLSHEFDSENICKYCKGKVTVEHTLEGVTDRWGREHPATGREDICYVTYPDGQKELYWRRHENIVVDHGGIPGKGNRH